MNYLKIKFGLFSFLAVFAASVLMTSCEQEITPTNEVSDVSISENSLNVDKAMTEVLLPHGYDQLSQEEQEQYVKSLDEVTIFKLIESSKILNYFDALGKKDALLDNSEYGEIYGETTLSSYLTDKEVQEFQLFTNGNLESRGCDCDDYWQYRSCHTGYFYNSYGQITLCYYEKWVRECHAWYCWDKVTYGNYVCYPQPLPYCP